MRFINLKLNSPPLFLVYFSVILVQICFGLNFIASKIIVDSFPPIFWGQIRFITSGILLGIGTLFFISKKNPFKLSHLPMLFFFAAIGVTIPQVGYLQGIALSGPTNSSVISTTIPIFTVFLAIIRKTEEVHALKFFGLAISFIGILILRKVEDFHIGENGIQGDLLILFVCFLLALYFNLAQKIIQKYGHYWTTTLLFLIAGIQIMPFTFFHWPNFEIIQWKKILIGSMVFSILGGTLFTYFLGNWALIYIPPAQLAPFIYIQPMVNFIFAWSFDQEEMEIRKILSSLLIITGIILVNFKKLKGTEYPPKDPT